MKKEDLNLVAMEVQTSVSFTAFMTGVTLFFVGLLISQFKVFNSSINIPILFLIISTFGFLYATLIFANASGKVARSLDKEVQKDLNHGNALSEYLGVYLLILAIPLVINIISLDNFLKIATIIAALGGLIFYHVSGFSIMGRAYEKLHYLFLSLIVIFELLLYFFQFVNKFNFTLLAILMIVMLFSIAVFSDEKVY
jgi:hypothetical protein